MPAGGRSCGSGCVRTTTGSTRSPSSRRPTCRSGSRRRRTSRASRPRTCWRPAPTALAAEELDVAGVMAHLGRHHHAVDVWRAMASSFADTIGALSAAWGGWTPREIDVGGGFASPRDPTGRATTRGMRRPADERSPTIEAYADAVATSLRDGLRRHGVPTDGVRLEAEPGRALLADAGIHLATVRNVKAQTRPIAQRWVELDTTEMFLPDGLIEHNRWTVVVASRADRPVTQEADVVGMSCGFDVIVAGAALPDVEPGDVVAILDTGAYQDAASSNFNALPRPATVLVHGDRSEVVKRAETVDDVFRRDIVPERLGGDREATHEDPGTRSRLRHHRRHRAFARVLSRPARTPGAERRRALGRRGRADHRRARRPAAERRPRPRARAGAGAARVRRCRRRRGARRWIVRAPATSGSRSTTSTRSTASSWTPAGR